MKRRLKDVLVAFQFLTRLPFPSIEYDPDALARSAVYFPLVGILVGALGCSVYRLLSGHLPAAVVSVAVLVTMILLTGALHEDGLADVADGFGGGWNREQILRILKDSRIGSYGAIALILSLGARILLLASLPANRFMAFVLCAHVLCRWTTLPLGYFLKPARLDGQGIRVASNISLTAVSLGSFFSVAVSFYLLRAWFWPPVVAALIVTVLSGLYYQRRIGGVSGDCFGATNQLTEIAVYLCGVWH
jgi:adenosylcobinamide-GDP ribazoletransferase